MSRREGKKRVRSREELEGKKGVIGGQVEGKGRNTYEVMKSWVELGPDEHGGNPCLTFKTFP